MPTSFTPLERWLGLNLIASRATKIGTDACAIAATPESMCVSPQAISVKGSAPLIAPNTKPSRQAPRTLRERRAAARRRGQEREQQQTARSGGGAPSAPSARSRGTPTLMNRYDAPQIAASMSISGP